MSNLTNLPVTKKEQDVDDFQPTQVIESKFWRKVKQDPVVPIGRNFFLLKFC
jgi:hypothetical protein